MLKRSLRRGLVLEGPHRDGVHLFVHRREGQSRQSFTFRGRRRQTHADQHGTADHEHENRIMQKIHVHQSAEEAVIKSATTRGPVHQLQDETRRSHDEPGQ